MKRFILLCLVLVGVHATPQEAINRLSAGLLGELSEEQNLVFSAYSVVSGLSLIAGGAQGSTEIELEEFLSMPNGEGAAWAQELVELQERYSQNRFYNFLTADALWVQSGLQLKDSFISWVEEDLASEIQTVNFRRERDVCRRKINGWVARATEQQITALLPKEAIDSMTRLVLTNALYVEGNWAYPFSGFDSENASFTNKDGTRSTVHMMQQDEWLYLNHKDGYRILDLPYTGKRMTVNIFLPDDPDGFDAMVERIVTQPEFDGLLEGWEKVHVGVALPKFEVTSRLSLREALSSQGIPSSFEGANFAGITDDDAIHLDDIYHQVVLRVNEKGVGGSGGWTAGSGSDTPDEEFRVDRPFLFMVYDLDALICVFIGKVEKL